MSINWWMDKQNVVFPYNGILIGHNKEWSIDTCYNMDGPWKHYAKWKMPVIKDYILCDSGHLSEMSRIGQSIKDRDGGYWGRWGVTATGHGGFLWGWKYSTIDCGDGDTALWIHTKKHCCALRNGWIVWYVNYISVKLMYTIFTSGTLKRA